MTDRRSTALAVGAVAVVVGLAGCGSSKQAAGDGRTVFASNCQSCHSLVGNESLRRVGGDLLAYRLSRSDMLQLVGEMPVRRALDAKQVAVVSDYVLGLEHRAARDCPGGGC